jgi:hypothetical protein
MTSDIGLDFIGRTLRTYGIVLLILLPFGVYYYGVFPSLAILSGGVWSMINLMFITGLVKAAIRPEGADVPRTVLLLLVKFPALYVSGYFLLKVREFSALNLLIGFSGIIVIIALKAFGRYFLSRDAAHKQNLQGAL